MTPKHVIDKKILLRIDLNVPLLKRRISDDFRIRAALPTIQMLLKTNNQIFIISHLEQGNKIPHLDLVHKRLENLLHEKIHFLRGKIPQTSRIFSEPLVLFDNIRLNDGEKRNDPAFAKMLARWGDYFVDDAFSAMHRGHASIVGIPKYLPSTVGPLVERECAMLSKAFRPQKPFLFILGGAKFSTKAPLIKKFLNVADIIFIGGALANTFLKQRGINVGTSSIDKEKIPESILWHKKILLPKDVVVKDGKTTRVVSIDSIEDSEMVLDAGPKTMEDLSHLASSTKFILWNGTFGICEAGYYHGTKKLAQAIGKSKAYSIVGGGDTIAAIRQMKLEKNFDFISTGGGAMLEFLATGTLPGLEAIKHAQKNK